MNLKNSLNSFRALSSAMLFLVTVTSLISCGTAPSKNVLDEIPEHPFLFLQILDEGTDVISDGLAYEGPLLSSNWDPSLGIASINMDKELDGKLNRYGSFILGVDVLTSHDIAIITSAYISTSSCLICEPGEPINAKLYVLEPDPTAGLCNRILHPRVSSSYLISDEISRLCIVVSDTDDDELYLVIGEFAAINENPFQ